MSEEMRNDQAVETEAQVESIDSQLRRAFGVRRFDYVPEDNPDGLPPVRIEILPFFGKRLPEISDAVVRCGVMYWVEKRSLGDIAATATKDLLLILNSVVRLPDYPELTVGDLPIDCVAECFTYFIRGISPGKWQGLADEVGKRFEVDALAAMAAQN